MTDGSQQSLVVVAQTGTRLSDGTVIRETDSQAVQITADVTGSRSINAMNALTGTNDLGVIPLTGADAVIADIVQAAGIFNGFVGSRPAHLADRHGARASHFTGRIGGCHRHIQISRLRSGQLRHRSVYRSIQQQQAARYLRVFSQVPAGHLLPPCFY